MIRSDHPVPDVVRAYMDALPPGDWFFFDMSPLDRTGVPAWKAGPGRASWNSAAMPRRCLRSRDWACPARASTTWT